MRTINKKITFDSAGKVFFYNGEIQAEDDSFISFWDCKLGLIRLNKRNIVKIEDFEQ